VSSALSIEKLSKSYSNGVTALNQIDLKISEGDFFALLGPNGAGKSTLIGIVSGLINKTSGSIKVFDTDIDRNFPLAKSKIGLVPQEFNFSIFETPLQIIIWQAGYYGISAKDAMPRAEYLLKELDLWEKRNEQARTLSGGMKRRLLIARSLIHNPKLLILDEPTAGVDIEIRRSMWKFLEDINKSGTTIILTTHYLEEAESLCKNIAIISKGKVIENTTVSELLSRTKYETLILDTLPFKSIPSASSFGFRYRAIDASSIEVTFERRLGLNKLFLELGKADITVLSLKNKANRLEELFVNLVSKGELP
jgi:ABC-2 type transport system ATP-binding protein